MRGVRNVRFVISVGAALALIVGLALVTHSAPIQNPVARHFGPLVVQPGETVELTVTNLIGDTHQPRVQIIDEDGNTILNVQPTIQPKKSRAFTHTNESAGVEFVRGRLVTEKEHVKEVVASLALQEATQMESLQGGPTQQLSFSSNKIPGGPIINMAAKMNLQFLVTNLGSGNQHYEITLLNKAGTLIDTLETDIPAGDTKMLSFTAKNPVNVRPVLSGPAGNRAIASIKIEHEGVLRDIAGFSWGATNI